MIYINGDSFTAGAGVREEKGKEWTWPYLLEKKIGIKCNEEARSGCSNYRIYRYTLEQILSNKDLKIVVILWTQYQRQEFSIAGKNVTFMPSDNVSKKQHSKIYDVAWKYAYNELSLYQNWLRQIISLSDMCQLRNIKFYPFVYEKLCWNNTLETFIKNFDHYIDVPQTKKKFIQTKTLEDNCPKINFLDIQKIDLIQTGWVKGHPTRTGHEQICESIFNTINENA